MTEEDSLCKGTGKQSIWELQQPRCAAVLAHVTSSQQARHDGSGGAIGASSPIWHPEHLIDAPQKSILKSTPLLSVVPSTAK
jgi:hypothetical protein